MSRQRLALTALAALLALIVSVVIGSGVISSPPTIGRDKPGTNDPKSPREGSPTAVPEGLAAFRDPEDGISILYPETWSRVASSDKDVRLLVADGTRVSLLIRVVPVGLTVTPQTLGVARGLTDSLVGADRDVRLLSQPDAITLDGLPGYRYFYTFTGGAQARRGGAHVHYFLFRRKRLISLVFQVPGVRALKRDSGLLNRVAATFRAGK